uniref:LRRCT domain-containing protein n=1 Tax=Elaeophora elaphi TaxID=1147741 RepID=A0A0R3RJH9_9BILA
FFPTPLRTKRKQTGKFSSFQFILFKVVNVSHNWLRTARLSANIDDVKTDNSADSTSTVKCNNKAEQLIIFDLSYNQIRSIGDNDFIQLVAIRQLLLANNQISLINRNALKACALLQQLHVGNNSIEELPVMPETLIHLDVAWNRLSIIPSTIANLPNLLFLNLSGNAIDANTPFAVVSSTLQTVDLSRNRLEFIPENLFANSAQQLQHFLLSYNRITQLEPLFFQNYSNLLMVSFTVLLN